MHIDTKSSPGHANVFCVPLCLLCQPSSSSLASLRFFTCSRLILSFLNIFNRLRENSLLLPPSQFTILIFSPVALPTFSWQQGESLLSQCSFHRVCCHVCNFKSPHFSPHLNKLHECTSFHNYQLHKDKFIILHCISVGQLQLNKCRLNYFSYILNNV